MQNVCRFVLFLNITETIIVDAVNVKPIMRNYLNFHSQTFQGWRSILDKREHFAPQKFVTEQ